MPDRRILLAPLAALAGVALFLNAGHTDDPVKKKDDAPAKPKTAKVEKEKLTQTVTLKGVIEGEKGSELTLKPKVYAGPLVVKKAIEHGTTVKAGDVLVEFDLEKIDQQIKDAKTERESAVLALQMAELEAPLAEKQYAMDLAAAERDAKNAEDDFKKFKEIDRPLQVEAAEQALKSSAFFLETSRDELKQLSKMYKDKDLTEETEEIVLKRYKRTVEQNEFQFRAAKNRHEQLMKIDMPRRDIAAAEGVAKAQMALVKVKDVQSISQQLKKLSLAKMKADHAKSAERLADLEKDREAMTVKAPVAGMAYYGRTGKGSWLGGSLTVGGSVLFGDTFMTVVPVGKLTVRAEADEKEIIPLAVGNGGRVTPTSQPNVRLQAKIASLATAPMGGKFEVRADLLESKGKLVPGMTASMRVTTLTVADALTVPASAVHDSDDGETKFVHLPGKDRKQTVTVGITVGDRTQILSGLAAGDDILVSGPAAGGDK
jgi:multidrug efflux pump subunit AcrA (membrane-fusion protein)